MLVGEEIAAAFEADPQVPRTRLAIHAIAIGKPCGRGRALAVGVRCRLALAAR
jgi:hypothetical protein